MKKSISSKIITSYLVIVLASLVCAGLFFSAAVKSYAENQAKKILSRDAQIIADIFQRSNTGGRPMPEFPLQPMFRDRMRRMRSLNSSVAIIGREGLRILHSRSEEETEWLTGRFLPLIKANLDDSVRTGIKVNVDDLEYMAVIQPISPTGTANSVGWVILYTQVDQIRELSGRMLEIMLISLALTGLLALIFGVFFARSIATPIVLLKSRAEALSKRDFDSKVEIHTGDELEELANTINKMAVELKEYDVAQKKFLQNASHELKTPLMSIQGYAEGVRDEVFEDNARALEVIVEESTRLKSIVEELIFLSKLETMEDYYKYSIESINEVIDRSIEKVNSLAVKNNIKISPILTKDVNLHIDYDKFIQALINILGNCLRYAESEIKIKTWTDGKWYEIRISDDGEGFGKEDLSNIFERFYMGKKGSTGLGLAITKLIIEKHNGTITAENGLSGGAQFIIRIPVI